MFFVVKFYVQFIISTVKSRQISDIHTHKFLLKCKNHLMLPTDQSKSPKKTINIELSLLTGKDDYYPRMHYSVVGSV